MAHDALRGGWGVSYGGTDLMMAASMPEMAAAASAALPSADAAVGADGDDAAGAVDGGGGGGGGGGGDGGALSVRAGLVGTPLFLAALQVDASGRASVPWQLPDNLGVFELRAYAVSGARFGGAATAEQTVRRLASSAWLG